MDQNSAFISSLMNYLLTKFHISTKTVASYNYQSLQAEYVIKSLLTVLTKDVSALHQMSPKYLLLAT